MLKVILIKLILFDLQLNYAICVNKETCLQCKLGLDFKPIRSVLTMAKDAIAIKTIEAKNACLALNLLLEANLAENALKDAFCTNMVVIIIPVMTSKKDISLII